MAEYQELHRAGLDARLPAIECWPNQFPGYQITMVIPEYTSVCPKTSLPDFGTLTIAYQPDKLCVELKAMKYYLLAYRDLGIFYENAVNRILRDFVAACQPYWAVVKGEFNVRGGMRSIIEARYEKSKKQRRAGKTRAGRLKGAGARWKVEGSKLKGSETLNLEL